MPQIDAPDQRILETLDQLSPQGRREAIRRLLPGAQILDRAIARLRPQIEALTRERGLDWAKLSDEERESVVDELLHD